MTNLEKLEMILNAFYKISVALVAIADKEGSDYGYTEEVDMAEEYVKEYEKEHGNEH